MKKSEELYTERSEEFFDIAKEVSELVALLRLEKSVNDELVIKITQLVEVAESDSFERGVKVGVEYNIDKLAEVIESEIMGSERINRKLMQ